MARTEVFDRGRLGQRMAEARVGRGLKSADALVDRLARETGYHLSKESLYKYESGERLASIETLRAIQIALGLPQSYWDIAMTPAFRERWGRLEQ